MTRRLRHGECASGATIELSLPDSWAQRLEYKGGRLTVLNHQPWHPAPPSLLSPPAAAWRLEAVPQHDRPHWPDVPRLADAPLDEEDRHEHKRGGTTEDEDDVIGSRGAARPCTTPSAKLHGKTRAEVSGSSVWHGTSELNVLQPKIRRKEGQESEDGEVPQGFMTEARGPPKHSASAGQGVSFAGGEEVRGPGRLRSGWLRLQRQMSCYEANTMLEFRQEERGLQWQHWHPPRCRRLLVVSREDLDV
ncbi:hypothetical protein NMY22_g2179 [Coprinellus aureogranulatus]|nr:hypothetical protein NMY22_g2179 [Coprinellus aureogranulatus]